MDSIAFSSSSLSATNACIVSQPLKMFLTGHKAKLSFLLCIGKEDSLRRVGVCVCVCVCVVTLIDSARQALSSKVLHVYFSLFYSCCVLALSLFFSRVSVDKKSVQISPDKASIYGETSQKVLHYDSIVHHTVFSLPHQKII